MEFQTVTYATYAAASVTYAAELGDVSLGAEPSDAVSTDSGPHLTDSLAAFLLRVAAYFQGCLARFPRACSSFEGPQLPESLTFIDTALDGTSEPLVRVRMNRALSRRLRWMIRRGRVQRSGRLRVYNAQTEGRCHLTPGQMSEYCIRVYGLNRAAVYGLSRAWRRVTRGGVSDLGVAGLCAALLSPD